MHKCVNMKKCTFYILYLSVIYATWSQEHYGQYIEEQWCQLRSQTVGIIYLDKTTGLVQRERPSDYRPYLHASPFEEMIVELYNSADINQDGYVDYEEFVQVYGLFCSIESMLLSVGNSYGIYSFKNFRTHLINLHVLQ